MFKTRKIIFCCMVLVLLNTQPKPVNAQRQQGSYSDFPGRIQSSADRHNSNTGQQRSGPSYVPEGTSRYSAVKSNTGTINIPASSSFSAFDGNQRPTKSPGALDRYNAVDTKHFSSPKDTGQGVPFSALAASELAQNTKKPLSTGPDSWTPMGHLGTGQPFYPAPPPGSKPQLPYDTSQSKLTIGEQIRQKQRQQQQQQQQQYDIFGFPINNSPGATLGSNQSGLGGSGSSGGHGPGGEFLQMMLMMQLLGGADAPDPPPMGSRGRGRGSAASLTPMSALEQLIRLEEIRTMRNRQRDRVNRNRRLPENRRRGSFTQGFNQAGGKGSQWSRHQTAPTAFDTTNEIPRPPSTRSSTAVLPPSSSNKQNRQPYAAQNSFHPEVLDRRNMPSTPAPPGQEPIEREGPPQGQGAKHGQNRPQPTTEPRAFPRRRQNNFDSQRHQGGNNFGFQNHNTFENLTPRQYQHQNYNQISRRGPQYGQQYQSQSAVPRNMQQLLHNPLFQRQLRVAGASPGANPADVRADQADLMADRADNLQSMSPLERLLGGGIQGGFSGPMGLPSGQSGSRLPAAGLSSLASLFGSGGGRGLLALSMLGGA